MAPLYYSMSEREFPDPGAVHSKHFTDERFTIGVRYRTLGPHDCDPDNFIGGIPAGIEYFRVSFMSGNWDDDCWERLAEAYENEGFNTHLRKSSGVSRTRSGTCHHAPTSLYVW